MSQRKNYFSVYLSASSVVLCVIKSIFVICEILELQNCITFLLVPLPELEVIVIHISVLNGF
jgi:hypothetical protein